MTRTAIATQDFNTNLTGFTEANIGWNEWIRNSGTGRAYPRYSGTIHAGQEACAYWSGAGTFSNDQYAQCTLHDAGINTPKVGVVVRHNGLTGNSRAYYAAYYSGDGGGTPFDFVLAKRVSNTLYYYNSAGSSWGTGIPTFLTSAAGAGATLTLEAEGTTLRLYVDSTLLYTATDSDLASGKPGIIGGTSTTVEIDNWEGGDYTAGASAIINKLRGPFGGPFHKLI